jgi:ABC-type proline/glycine betaine transport system substrate-binding protein
VSSPARTSGEPRRPRAAAAAVLAGLLALSLAVAAPAAARAAPAPDPAGGDVQDHGAVRLARATWDTGWFQAEVIRELLERLGYRVDGPTTLENAAFYAAVAAGEVDLWANGWFPLHEQYLADLPDPGAAVPVGTAVRGGALEGYLIDRATAEAHGIDSLDDLRDPRLARLFDRDGDGRADLIGCNPDWACAASIDAHLDALDLRATVEQVQGDYSPLMAEAVDRFGSGEPLLFYTWTPNWTVGELVPGRHVVWLEVPPVAAGHGEPAPRIADVPGSDRPLRLGWPPNDIRIVANRSFLAGNPAIAALLERVRIPIADIHRQNGRMIRGEDDPADFRQHARDWIDRHRDQVDRWLQAARAHQDAAPAATAATVPHTRPEERLREDVLRVATQRVEPFVTYHDRRYSGFSIELWQQIAAELGLDYELYGVNSLAKLLDDVERGAADAATAGIGITSEREVALDFSHAYFESGLQILVRDPDPSLLHSLLARVRSIVVSRQLLYVTGLFLLMLLVSAHAVWLFERAHNPQFPSGYLRGVGEAFWWAAVTVTTVGYGDKTPRRSLGKAFALLWMFAGYFVFAYFTASVASSFTVSELQGTIAGPDDLFGKRVATVARTPAAEYLERMGIEARKLPAVDAAIARLESGAVEAVVYDAPVLQHHASHAGRGSVHVVGPVFWQQQYGIALAADSPLRDPVNQALLRLMEQGEYQRIQERWFGRSASGE